MRKTLLVTLILLAITARVFAEQYKSTGTVDVFFSPNGGTTGAVVSEIDFMRNEILVQATRSPVNL